MFDFQVQPNIAQGSSGEGAATERIKRAIRKIDEAPERCFSSFELAQVACMSGFHFIRQFKRVTGVTPQAYVRRGKILYAKRLIAGGELSMAEVAHACGFASQSHFSTTFKAMCGMTPMDFKLNRTGPSALRRTQGLPQTHPR